MTKPSSDLAMFYIAFCDAFEAYRADPAQASRLQSVLQAFLNAPERGLGMPHAKALVWFINSVLSQE